MSDEHSLPVNHHGDHPGFAGLTGGLFAAAFLLTGRAHAKLAADLMQISPEDHVVDIGCGPGNAIRTAAHRGALATGVDPSPSMLRMARIITRDRTVHWAEGSAESLPVADGWATVVWALATVHHWRDAAAGVAEVYRVLSSGGRLLAVERQCRPDATGFASHGWTAQQAESFAALCRSAGFIDVRVAGHSGGRRQVWTVIGVRP